MTKFLSAAVVVACFAAACGGTTETEDPGTAGSSGAGTAGKASGGKTGTGGVSATAGVSMGGAVGEGATAGQGQGGVTVAGAAGAAGAPSVDKRCPAKRPTGACGFSSLSCIYSSGTNCLCYPNAPNTFRPCQQVDPQCTYSTAPPPEDAGSGGYSAKVVLPPTQSCSCNAETWTCNFF